MARRVVVVTDNECIGKDEMWCKWYRCSNCGNHHIGEDFKYCPDCGRKIDWQVGKPIEDTTEPSFRPNPGISKLMRQQIDKAQSTITPLQAQLKYTNRRLNDNADNK